MSLPLRVALKQCKRHASALLDALSHIPRPVTAQQLEKASPELARFLDQFTLRVTKLQDTLGVRALGVHKLRQFAVEVLQEPIEDVAFIDVSCLLEKRGYLMSDDWSEQRRRRNALMHEYPEDKKRQAEALSKAQVATDQLIEWLAAVIRSIKTSTPRMQSA